MEPLGKRIANGFRFFVWSADYALFKALRVFSKEEALPKDIKNILVIELLFMGDVIVTTPAVRALKKKFPKADITMLLLPSMKDIYTGNPNVSSIITYTKEDIKNNLEKIAKGMYGKYDLAVILHPGSWHLSKLLCKADIPCRIGCTKVGLAEGKGFFLHNKLRPSLELRHKLEDNLDVVRMIGADLKDKHLEIYTTKKAEDYIDNIVKNFIVIHAAPQHFSHHWDEGRFAKTADTLAKKYNKTIVFSGSKDDIEYNDKIMSLMEEKALNLAGKTDIKQFFALIKKSRLVVSVDTSAMHVAAAFNKPVIALFGAGNPKIWRPYCKNSIVIFKDKEACTSCMKHKCLLSRRITGRAYECMRAITVDNVLNGVEKLKWN